MYINAIFSRFRDMLICNVQYSEFGPVISTTRLPLMVRYQPIPGKMQRHVPQTPAVWQISWSNFLRIRYLNGLSLVHAVHIPNCKKYAKAIVPRATFCAIICLFFIPKKKQHRPTFGCACSCSYTQSSFWSKDLHLRILSLLTPLLASDGIYSHAYGMELWYILDNKPPVLARDLLLGNFSYE